MKKILLVAVCSLILLTGCTNKSNSDNLNNNKTNNSATQDNETKDSDVKVSNIKVTIDNKTYTLELEDNETARSFIDLLPQEYSMSELNGNEKYIYLDSSLPTNSSNPKHINSGDVMLYGDNCLVIFYKSFDTSYSYTKIGHIDNLDNLGNGKITVKFEKVVIDNNELKEDNMKLKVNDKVIDIVIYDTVVGNYIKNNLPYKATIQNSGVDLCGDAGKNIKYAKEDLTSSAKKGDIMYFEYGNYFSIFLTDYNTGGASAKIGKIVNEEDVDYLKNNTSKVTIEIYNK